MSLLPVTGGNKMLIDIQQRNHAAGTAEGLEIWNQA